MPEDRALSDEDLAVLGSMVLPVILLVLIMIGFGVGLAIAL